MANKTPWNGSPVTIGPVAFVATPSPTAQHYPPGGEISAVALRDACMTRRGGVACGPTQNDGRNHLDIEIRPVSARGGVLTGILSFRYDSFFPLGAHGHLSFHR